MIMVMMMMGAGGMDVLVGEDDVDEVVEEKSRLGWVDGG
jgi:hypothetical protein